MRHIQSLVVFCWLAANISAQHTTPKSADAHIRAAPTAAQGKSQCRAGARLMARNPVRLGAPAPAASRASGCWHAGATARQGNGASGQRRAGPWRASTPAAPIRPGGPNPGRTAAACSVRGPPRSAAHAPCPRPCHMLRGPRALRHRQARRALRHACRKARVRRATCASGRCRGAPGSPAHHARAGGNQRSLLAHSAAAAPPSRSPRATATPTTIPPRAYLFDEVLLSQWPLLKRTLTLK